MKVAFVGVEDGTSVEGATVNGSDDDWDRVGNKEGSKVVGVTVGVDVFGACEGKAVGATVKIDGLIVGENVTGAEVTLLSSLWLSALTSAKDAIAATAIRSEFLTILIVADVGDKFLSTGRAMITVEIEYRVDAFSTWQMDIYIFMSILRVCMINETCPLNEYLH
jgi:hypothetical protein